MTAPVTWPMAALGVLAVIAALCICAAHIPARPGHH